MSFDSGFGAGFGGPQSSSLPPPLLPQYEAPTAPQRGARRRGWMLVGLVLPRQVFLGASLLVAWGLRAG